MRASISCAGQGTRRLEINRRLRLLQNGKRMRMMPFKTASTPEPVQSVDTQRLQVSSSCSADSGCVGQTDSDTTAQYQTHRRQRAAGCAGVIAGLQSRQREVAQGAAVGQVQQLDCLRAQQQLLKPAAGCKNNWLKTPLILQQLRAHGRTSRFVHTPHIRPHTTRAPPKLHLHLVAATQILTDT